MSRAPTRKSPAELQKQVDDFNLRYPIGQAVTVCRDDGTGLSTVTRSEAQVLFGHSAVVWLEGISGCYLLDRVTPMTGPVDHTEIAIALTDEVGGQSGDLMKVDPARAFPSLLTSDDFDRIQGFAWSPPCMSGSKGGAA